MADVRNKTKMHNSFLLPSQVAMVPAIVNHAMRTKSLADLEYFWREWRSVLADRNRAKSAFISYVRMLRLAASYNGMFLEK